MQLWLDTINPSVIREADQMGMLHGITTNPLQIAHAGVPLEDLLKTLLEVQKGPVAIHLLGTTVEEIVKQAELLYRFSSRIIGKIPVTREGLCAISALSKKNIPVMAAVIFDTNQMLLAARAGATYLVPHYARICEEDPDGIDLFHRMVKLVNRYQVSSKILAAFLSSAEQVRTCADLGIDAVSISEKIFEDYVRDHPWTLEVLSKFRKDWKKLVPSKTFG